MSIHIEDLSLHQVLNYSLFNFSFLGFKSEMILKNIFLFIAGLLFGSSLIIILFKKRIFNYETRALPKNIYGMLVYDDNQKQYTIVNKIYPLKNLMILSILKRKDKENKDFIAIDNKYVMLLETLRIIAIVFITIFILITIHQITHIQYLPPVHVR